MIAHINDKLFEQCGGDAGIEKILLQFGKYKLTDDAIVLSSDERKTVQEILDKTVKSGTELIAAIRNLSAVSIQGLKFTFTPEQLSRLDDQAKFYEKPLKDYIYEMVSMQMKVMLGEV